MPNYYIKNTQDLNGEVKNIFYLGDRAWTTEYEHRKIYNKKADANKELTDFGGVVVKDSVYNPDAVDGDGDGIVQEGTEFERVL